VSVELRNESGAPVDETALVDVARFVMEHFGVHPQIELSVYVVDEDSIARMNEHHKGEAGSTDVLAFPMDELSTGRREDEDDGPPTLLGDVVLCPAVASRQAAAAGHGETDELALLTTHGVLHLLGYDHAEPEDEREMFELQAQLLSGWRAARGRR
jgi:probable rRNA maturation factor